MKPKSSTSKTGASPPRRRQQGAVLVVGLIILVVLTLMGVQAMRTNLVQERMASNMRDRNLAFQAAEAALRAGEAYVQGQAAADLPDPANWDGAYPLPHGRVKNFDAGVASEPVFHIGKLPGVDSPSELHLVTARGVGGQATSVVVLQSTFELPATQPDGSVVPGRRQNWRQLR
ncbi:PilX N-terminal domain-containing pilus assembly protein [Hydrogenophaga sp.]|uniref:pilus assembly PilX family protein n=1 Tax=Hydrogenophaga sp. TaxID=1904254 RepID=UPI0019949F97|nr:PilX N-terminal domain-containing pilus assembly protein [Hydrogenophaga sp.]MBD3893974.1 pilus assembly protein PilX [Hydrogenophaga sp.]